MMMEQWHRHHHIYENYSPHVDFPDCAGEWFYNSRCCTSCAGHAGPVSSIEVGCTMVTMTL
jgi:hypothetical protein